MNLRQAPRPGGETQRPASSAGAVESPERSVATQAAVDKLLATGAVSRADLDEPEGKKRRENTC